MACRQCAALTYIRMLLPLARKHTVQFVGAIDTNIRIYVATRCSREGLWTPILTEI
jgi:hypothetical protein